MTAFEDTATGDHKDDVLRRALALWPGLDRAKLSRTCGDPVRVARLVEKRTTWSRDAIVGMLRTHH